MVRNPSQFNILMNLLQFDQSKYFNLIQFSRADKHPVKVGVSDAYIVDKTVYHARRKTIFEYHRVNFPGPKISNFTTIRWMTRQLFLLRDLKKIQFATHSVRFPILRLTPLTTCNTFTDCHSCLTADLGFKCSWCPTLGRCSSGVDRKRQEWTNHSE